MTKGKTLKRYSPPHRWCEGLLFPPEQSFNGCILAQGLRRASEKMKKMKKNFAEK